MLGFAHIFKLGEAPEGDGSAFPRYQFTFNFGGNSYARTFDEPELRTFLTDDLALRDDILQQALTDLRANGTATISDLHISENDAAMLGLQEVGSDY